MMLEFILEYWIEVFFAIIVSVIGAAIKYLSVKFKEMKKDFEAQKKGIQVILRDRIVQAYYKYSETETITQHGLENVLAMYNEYHELGGNGTVTILVEAMEEYRVVDRVS